MLRILLFFFLIFGFRIPLIASSTILAGMIASVGLFNSTNREFFFRTLKSKFILRIFLTLVLLSFLYFVVITFHATNNQFLFLKTFFAQFVFIFSTLLVSSLILKFDGKDEIRLLRYFLIIFVMQTIIQVLSFSVPAIYNLVSLFQVEEAKQAVLASQKVGLFRGYSLAGDLFFGMGAMYGVGFIILTHLLLLNKLQKPLAVGLFILLVIGTVFSARTGFIGILFASLYLILSKVSFKFLLKLFLWLVMFLFFTFICIYYFLPKHYFSIISEHVIPFAFEFIISFFNNGSIETSSTSHLYKMLDISVDLNTFLFGDGKYLNIDGSYYRHTDSGYLRGLLFWGIGGLLCMVFYQISFFRFKKPTLQHKRLFLIIFLYILVLQIKGEAIGKIHMLNMFLVSYFVALKNDVSYSIKSSE